MAEHYIAALPVALIGMDGGLTIGFVNPAAEHLLAHSAAHLIGKSIHEVGLFDEQLRTQVARAVQTGEDVAIYEYTLNLPQQPGILTTLHITPLVDEDKVLLSITRSGGHKRQAASAWKQEATRTAGVMAAMLAHEVKNPLSGIRGAAQLLREEVPPDYQPLTDLICMESDRIRDLLNQVEVFSVGTPLEKQGVNIHEVLQYVISVAQAGFAKHVKFIERYDPSLPSVLGHRDSLVQLFLNLVKNAAEALAKQEDATITLHSQYRSGYRMQAEAGEPVSLPVAVSVEDNGPGIPASIRPHIFEPLISTKDDGRGLGLAVVAKLAVDSGAVVELDEEKTNGTKFTVMLPIYNEK